MKKGFSYTLEKEKLIEYLKLSTEDKLKWLEEINAFNRMVMDDQGKNIKEKLRAGEL
jgi:hypothetical protein